MMDSLLIRYGLCRGWILFAVLAGILGCSPGSEDGVELVLKTAELEPSATFEVRFHEEFVLEGDIGETADPSPLVFDPSIAGKFVWLSRRSGVFTPSQPPSLATTYRLTLRPGLTNAAGRPSSASLNREVRTPPLRLLDSVPRQFNPGNIPSRPRLDLIFNARVMANPRFFEFQGNDGRTAGASVEVMTSFRAGSSVWQNKFPELAGPMIGTGSIVSDSETGHVLRVTPIEALEFGMDWKLVVVEGLRAVEFDTGLPENVEIVIGRVTPMEVSTVRALDGLVGQRSIELNFNRRLHYSMVDTNLAKWIALSPEVADFNVTARDGYVRLGGDFQLRTPYRVTVYPGVLGNGGQELAHVFTNLVEFDRYRG